MLTTELKTPDNKEIIMPNNKVAKSEIINYSYQMTRRVDFKFSVAYGSKIDKVKSVISGVIDKHNLVLKDNPMLIRLFEHGSSSLVFVVRVWTNTPDYWTVYYDLQEQIYEALNANKIEIPYNKLDVNIRRDTQ